MPRPKGSKNTFTLISLNQRREDVGRLWPKAISLIEEWLEDPEKQDAAIKYFIQILPYAIAKPDNTIELEGKTISSIPSINIVLDSNGTKIIKEADTSVDVIVSE